MKFHIQSVQSFHNNSRERANISSARKNLQYTLAVRVMHTYNIYKQEETNVYLY